VNPRAEILYVSSVPDAEQFQRIKDSRRAGIQEVTYGMPEASFTFHTLIQHGLLAQGCHVHSLVGRPVSRRFYRGHFWRRRVSTPTPGLTIDHLAMPLARALKLVWLAASFVVHARRWERRTRGADRRVLVVDAAYVSVMPWVLRALRGSDVVKIGVFADLYSYMAEVADASNRRSGFVHALARREVATSFRLLDGYVVLTRQMAAVVNAHDKPYLVMEGLVDAEDPVAPARPAATRSGHPTVLYAGALRREYGLDLRVGGQPHAPEPDAELVVYGQGDYASELAAIAAADSRITYRGAAPRADVLQAEREAWLLVNPRPADQEFTQFSFPSKNMEYLASGTAVLTTRLPGMPAEYLEHVLTIDTPGPEGVAEALAKAFAEGRDALARRGDRGRAFVLEQKNNVRQAGRILELAEECRP